MQLFGAVVLIGFGASNIMGGFGLSIMPNLDILIEQKQYIKAAKEVHLSEKERAVTKQQLKEFMQEIDDCLAKLVE